MNVEVQESEGGSVFGVKVHPGARRNRVEGCWNGLVRVSTTAVAEKGKANRSILELLADHLKVAKSRMILVSGESSRTKRVQVKDLGAEELRRALSDLPVLT